MSKQLKLVIFDCDGTLVDSQRMIVAAMHHAFRAIGLSAPPRETLLGIVGLSLGEAFTHLGDGDSHYPVADLVAHYREAFALPRSSGRHLEPLYPGAREAIDVLAARSDVRLGIATGKS